MAVNYISEQLDLSDTECLDATLLQNKEAVIDIPMSDGGLSYTIDNLYKYVDEAIQNIGLSSEYIRHELVELIVRPIAQSESGVLKPIYTNAIRMKKLDHDLLYFIFGNCGYSKTHYQTIKVVLDLKIVVYNKQIKKFIY